MIVFEKVKKEYFSRVQEEECQTLRVNSCLCLIQLVSRASLTKANRCLVQKFLRLFFFNLEIFFLTKYSKWYFCATVSVYRLWKIDLLFETFQLNFQVNLTASTNKSTKEFYHSRLLRNNNSSLFFLFSSSFKSLNSFTDKDRETGRPVHQKEY